ncbi:hypothetical protein DQ04_05731040 [Trypanosoma grayi]|uniref:hypothetical protein n=1 Tax=Trypanosoma grayi TaxID=71804 RepID=UPI0004F4A2F5|nr:hypothetical protein DQ04_05731040 [Trypanosoma grayi]KEG09142.1 hypothetical protein DQ04_05731040 [Trypanosoma grayi]
MATALFEGYVAWVRNNAENAMSLERFSRMLAIMLTDPRNLLTKELSWTLIRLHAFSNHTILTTAGRRVRFTDKVAILSRIIPEMECLLELLLRRYCGHTTAWNVLLVLQSMKCVFNLLVHRQLFLVPWIWAAVRRRLQQLLSLGAYGRRLSSAVARGDSHTLRSGAVGPAKTQLVIPRVAARRLHHRTAPDAGEDAGDVDGGKSLPCTALDLLGIAVDLVLLLRPLLLLYSARRVFPRDAAGIATLPYPQRVDKSSSNAASKEGAECDADGLFLVRAVLADGASKSLMSNWGVWLSFFGLDACLILLSRYIRRHRVPVVYIDKEDSCGQLDTNGGEVPSRSMENSHNGGGGDGNSNGRTTPRIPPLPLPRPPGTDVVAESTPVVSRDSLRVQQALRNMAYSFLQSPFFTAVLQKFLYDHFVVGRLNRIPLLGPLLGYQVAYLLCKQHYCFMYFLGQ